MVNPIKGKKYWDKIAYFSRQNTGIRVMAIAWVAVYLLCYHLKKTVIRTAMRQRLAIAMALLMLITAAGPHVIQAQADETQPITEEGAPLNEEEEIPVYSAIIQVEPYTAPIYEGYEIAPEVKITITNTGNQPLTDIKFQTQLFHLEFEKPDEASGLVQRYPIVTQTELERIGIILADTELVEQVRNDERVAVEHPEVVEVLLKQELISEQFSTITPGQNIEVFAVLPMGQPSGSLDDTLMMSSVELENPVSGQIHLDIQRIELPSEPGVSDATEDITGTDDNTQTEEIIPATVSIVDRSNGYFQGGTYYSMGNGSYTFSVTNSENCAPQNLLAIWDENGVTQECPFEIIDGVAKWEIPSSIDAAVQFGYKNDDGTFVAGAKECIMAEQNKPEVEIGMSKSDSSLLQVKAIDGGEVISGISEVYVMIDGVLVDEAKISSQQTREIACGSEVVSSIMKEIKLKSGTHEVEVAIMDAVGNGNVVAQRVYAMPNGVISVMVPTEFHMSMLSTAEGNVIRGDNIVVFNNGNVPIEVSIASVDVSVNKQKREDAVVKQTVANGKTLDLNSIEKTCDLKMDISMYQKEVETHCTPEGISEELSTFVLQPNRNQIDVTEVRNKVESARQEFVYSEADNYAVIRFRGTYAKGTENLWKNGDLKVNVVYAFRVIE